MKLDLYIIQNKYIFEWFMNAEIKSIEKIDILFFQEKIVEFSKLKFNTIPKPWKKARNPYPIWLFEVIMQQTRMEQGMPYFEKIIKHYPTIHSLAIADEDELFSLWKGLGYYSRARNLQYTARYIVDDLKSVFPKSYRELLKLKGVGEYTAAAIALFAFKEDIAVLDGNVHRVLSRFFGIEKTIQSSKDKTYFQTLANKLLIKEKSDVFNQAMMDMGSYICKPQNPNCVDCVISEYCVAFQKNKIKDYPPPKKRLELKTRYFYCLFIIVKDKIYLQKRLENDIWKGLYQGLLLESKTIEKTYWRGLGIDIEELAWSEWNKQVLSHQKVFMKIGIIKLNSFKSFGFKSFSIDEIKNLAFPRIISRWWEDYFKE